MKKIIIFIVILVVLAAAGAGLYKGRKTTPSVVDGRIQVVTSGYVPYTVARQIGGDKINLSMLLPANAEPHSFEPTPGSIIAVNKADVFVYVSGRLEPWVKEVVRAASPQTKVVEAAQTARPSQDPHIWMDFDNMRPFAQAVEEALAEKDPQNEAFYKQNLEKFNQELEELDQQYRQTLADCETRRIVHVGHLAFGNLAQRYGLELTALAGTSHDGEHSVKRLAQVVDLVKNSGSRYVFTEQALSQNLADVVARETNAQLIPLYTVEHVSVQDWQNGASYAQLMKRNLAGLKRGLVCQL